MNFLLQKEGLVNFISLLDLRLKLETLRLREREMAHTGSNSSMHRSSSRPQLDLSKAEIQGNFEEKYPTILLPNQSHDISHLALDIGGICILL